MAKRSTAEAPAPAAPKTPEEIQKQLDDVFARDGKDANLPQPVVGAETVAVTGGTGSTALQQASTGKPNETKSERFSRLASQRVSKALKMLSSIRNLANRAQYEYTDDQAAKVCDALATEVRRTAQAFAEGVSSKDTFFTV